MAIICSWNEQCTKQFNTPNVKYCPTNMVIYKFIAFKTYATTCPDLTFMKTTLVLRTQFRLSFKICLHLTLVLMYAFPCVTSTGFLYIRPLLIWKDNYFMLKILVRIDTLLSKTCAVCTEFIIHQCQADNGLSFPPQTKKHPHGG